MTPYLLVAAETPEAIGGTLGLDGRLFDFAPTMAERSDRFIHAPGRAGGVAFDGIGVFGETLITDSAAMARASGDGRGNYFVERHTDDGGIVFEIDPLGFYPLVIYHEAGLFAASNSSALLARALRRLGRHVPRDTSIFAWFITQGSGFRNLTGFRGLSLLEAGSRVRIDGRNKVTIERRPWSDLLYGSGSFAELLDSACDEILGNVRALAAAALESRVCDLSGGMDSRLVLAAIVHERLQDSFRFRTKGNYPNPDVNVAALIRSELGLRKAAHANRGKAWVLSPLEKLRLEQGRFSALKPTITGEGPRARPETHLSLGGGAGELLREYWSSRGGASGEGDPLEQKQRAISRRGAVLTPQAREALVDALREFADEALNQDVRPRDVGDLLYLTTRAKYHFGVPWSHASHTRFHPLYSPSAIKAARALSDEDRADNRLGFEIMRRFSPALVNIPFADKAWSARLVASPPEPVTAQTPWLVEPAAPVARRRSRRTRPRQELGDLERTLVKAGRKAKVVTFGAALREFLAQGRDYSILQPCFDADAVKSFIERPHEEHLKGRYDVNNAYRIIGAYIWASEIEILNDEVPRSAREPAALPTSKA